MVQETTNGLRGDGTPASAIPNAAWAIAAGTVDAITAGYDPENLSLTDGLLLCFRASGANLTTTTTFSPDNHPAFVITKRGGVALAAGDIPGAGFEAILRLNKANARWELLNPHTP